MKYLHVFAVLCATFCAATAARAENISSIVVKGNERISQGAVLNYLGIKPGGNASQAALNRGLKRLYDTGFFSDITLSTTNETLTVLLEENPSVNQVAFEGNTAIDTADLEKEITLTSRGIYTKPRVQADLKRLLDVYRRNGRYSAEIQPKIIPLSQNRVNLVYEIHEGLAAKIRKISFIGNKAFDAADLREAMSSAESRWYAFLTSSDQYDPDRLRYDQELLRKFYNANGFADFKVKSAIAELSPTRDAFYLTFTIEEGPRYEFGKIDVASSLPEKVTKFDEKTILSETGDLYNATDIDDTIDRMIAQLGDRGYAFVDIFPRLKRTPPKNEEENGTIDLTYDIKEGPRVYVERINIQGNQRTLDEVIRREFRLAEGDAYSRSKLERTEQRLNNLGFFETVAIKENQGSSPDKTDINVEVAERSTGEISLGAGFSNVDGPLADIGMRERNFLGRGQDVRARVLFSGRRQQYDLGFTEPYFLGRDIDAGIDLYKSTFELQREASFDRDTTGGRLRLGYQLSEHWRHSMRYGYDSINISNVDINASRFIRDQQGTITTSLIGQSFTFDDRDNRFNPNSGAFFNYMLDVAGLGGDNRFIRNEVQSEYYMPLAKQWTGVFFGAAGHIQGLGRDVGIDQRFFIGNQELRGFEIGGIGPRDLATNDVLGGNTYFANTLELRFPLGFSDDLGISGAAFHDIGSLFGIDGVSGAGVESDTALRASVGVGVAWNSPFGPVRVDFAFPYLKEDFDQQEVIRFNFGTRF